MYKYVSASARDATIVRVRVHSFVSLVPSGVGVQELSVDRALFGLTDAGPSEVV
jgi:hypothetical protein